MAILAVGVTALGTALFIGKMRAQAPATSPAPGTTAPAAVTKTRVGLVNLSKVIKNYDKFKAFQEELKKTVDPYQARDTGLKKQAEDLAKEAQKPTTTQEKRDQIETQMKGLQRHIEDNKNDAQKALVKKQEEQLKILYMDVSSIVYRIAQAHGFDLVMHYNDAVAEQDIWSAQNIARKMQAGALVPMYASRGLDISDTVVATLNAQYKSAAPAPAAPVAPATGVRPATPGGR